MVSPSATETNVPVMVAAWAWIVGASSREWNYQRYRAVKIGCIGSGPAYHAAEDEADRE